MSKTLEDAPHQLLMKTARDIHAPCLWLADESFSTQSFLSLNRPQDRVITNRYDIYEALKHQEYNVVFCDFDSVTIGVQKEAAIFIRVSKEKALTHFLINQAYQQLPLGGELHLAGYKGDGIKTYSDKAKKLFGELIHTENGPNTAKRSSLKKTSENGSLLDDKDYSTTREIYTLNDLPVQSKPGVFGWNKQDQGSAFLIEHLSDLLETIKQPIETVLDLGCGYGFITIEAFSRFHRLQASRFTLTDNNAPALRCADINCNTFGINASTIPGDCGSTLTETFDLILCNPPFHKGFDVSNDISDHFIANTHKRLSKKGYALFVVNQFVGIEKRAEKHFLSIQELARNKSFKLIVLSKPKR